MRTEAEAYDDDGPSEPEMNQHQKIVYVVVDDNGPGYTFDKDANGKPFTAQSAAEFARLVNSKMKPDYRSYRVYLLVDAKYTWPALVRMVMRAAGKGV